MHTHERGHTEKTNNANAETGTFILHWWESIKLFAKSFPGKDPPVGWAGPVSKPGQCGHLQPGVSSASPGPPAPGRGLCLRLTLCLCLSGDPRAGSLVSWAMGF